VSPFTTTVVHRAAYETVSSLLTLGACLRLGQATARHTRVE
jgi:hypothetical protein